MGKALIEPDHVPPSFQPWSITLPRRLLLGDLGQVIDYYPPAYPSSHPILTMVGATLQTVLPPEYADGPHVTPTYVDRGIPFVTVQNITSGRVDFSDLKYITLEDHRQFQRRARVDKGDVLVSKDGTIGIPCLVDTNREFSFFVSVALIKPVRDILDGRFLTWVLRAPYMQERMRERSRGDMIRHLVLREIRDLTRSHLTNA